jgi:hypothetical protein
MLKKLILGVGLAAGLAACAHTPSAPIQPTAWTPPAQTLPAGCVSGDATRGARDSRCAGPGSTYTKGDIQRTGQTDVGTALQMLDPRISISRGQ